MSRETYVTREKAIIQKAGKYIAARSGAVLKKYGRGTNGKDPNQINSGSPHLTFETDHYSKLGEVMAQTSRYRVGLEDPLARFSLSMREVGTDRPTTAIYRVWTKEEVHPSNQRDAIVSFLESIPGFLDE
jgi:hypothetical protein